MLDKIVEIISSLAKNFKGFIIENGTNPVLWMVLFFGGVLIFWTVYNSLHKNG